MTLEDMPPPPRGIWPPTPLEMAKEEVVLLEKIR